MKYEVRKYNYGGPVFTPILESSFAPQQGGGANPAPITDGSSVDKGSILDDETVKHLYKIKGLTNDVNKFISELIALERSSEFALDNRETRQKALYLIAKSNELENNKEYWKESIQKAKDSGGLGELAVDSHGRVFMKTADNEIKTITPEKYNSLKKKSPLLTVQQLMYERQYNSNLTNQNQVFTVADNSIGIKQINANIQTLITAFGKTTNSTDRVYSKREAQQIAASLGQQAPTEEQARSLAILSEVINSPGEYVRIESKTSTERAHISNALKYIWRSLGTPAQTKLTALAKLNGEDDAASFLLNMMIRGTDHEESLKVSTVKTDTALGVSADGESSKKVSLSVPELFYGDRLYTPGKTYQLNHPNANVVLNMTATGVGPLYALGKMAEVIGPTSIPTILTTGGYQTILDPSQAFIGDTRIPQANFGQLAYSGGDVAKVYAPVKNDGGIDIASLEKFQQIYDVFHQNKENWSTIEAERYFRSNGFEGVRIKRVTSPDGKVVNEIVENNLVKPFLAIPVLTNSATEVYNNPWMERLRGQEGDRATQIMESAFTVYTGGAKNPKKIASPPSSFTSLERPYAGTLFIGFRKESSAILSSMYKNLRGEPAFEQDVQRNLWNSSNDNSAANVNAASNVLINP